MRRRCRAAPSPGSTACRRLDPFEVGLACVWRHDARIKYLAAGGATALQHEPPRAQMRTKHGVRAWTVGGRRCGRRFAGIMKGVSPSIGSRPRSATGPSLNHAPGRKNFSSVVVANTGFEPHERPDVPALNRQPNCDDPVRQYASIKGSGGLRCVQTVICVSAAV
jgi:hypothetical protein